MRILASFSSLKLIAKKRNRILLLVLTLLTKYIIRVYFRSIDFYY